MAQYMGCPPRPRNKAQEQSPAANRCHSKEVPQVAETKDKISTSPDDRKVGQTIAGTGPGIPDDALAPGEELPTPPSDEEAERLERKLGIRAEQDTLPLDGE